MIDGQISLEIGVDISIKELREVVSFIRFQATFLTSCMKNRWNGMQNERGVSMKNARQAMILNLVNEREIRTQEELAEILREQGVNVTQATVSRDIKELRLLKILSPSGGYRYATSEQAEHGISERFVRLFTDSVLSIESAGNIVVIRTLSGAAAVAGEAIDGMRWEEILGSISGDNTIFVVVRTPEEATLVVNKFKEILH